MAVQKSLMFYIAGGLLSLVLLAYVVFLINVLVSQLSVISGTQLLQPVEIVTYDFAKFKQIKGASQLR